MHPSLVRRALAFAWALLSLIALLSFPAFTQSTSGRIVGRIADPTGAVLAGVKVSLINEATGSSRDTTSNGSGDYSFVEVVPAVYDLQFELTGFKKSLQKGVTVNITQVVTLNKVLDIGETQEVVEVTSEAQQV